MMADVDAEHDRPPDAQVGVVHGSIVHRASVVDGPMALPPLLQAMPAEVQTRNVACCTVAAVLTCLLFVNVVVTVVAAPSHDPEVYGLFWVASSVGLAASLTAAIACAVFRSTPTWLPTAYLACLTLTAMMLDLHESSRTLVSRQGAVFVLILTLTVVMGVAKRGAVAIMFVVILWNVVMEGERILRFGLLDAWGLPDQRMRLDITRCRDPPCGAHASTGMTAVTAVVVYGLNYFLLYRHTRTARAETDKLRQALHAAHEFAAAAAVLDIDAARRAIETAVHLPPDIEESFCLAVGNFEVFRTYVPTALFPHSTGASCGAAKRRLFSFLSCDSLAAIVSEDGSVPGARGQPAAIVFTDIRQSTALWEHSGMAMQQALATHNKIIRGAIADHDGYEVKTIGDAFMIAFHSVPSAVAFGSEVQTALAKDGIFPNTLVRGVSDEFPVFAIRIGIHWGPATIEQNVLTGRYDYFGPTVNKAARVESLGAPGAITVTAQAMEYLRGTGVCNNMIVMPFSEKKHAKGLIDAIELVAVVPKTLWKCMEPRVRAHCSTVAAAGKEGEGGGTAGAAPGNGNSIAPDSSRQTPGVPPARPPRGDMPAPQLERAMTATVGTVKFDFCDASQTPDRVWQTLESRSVYRLQYLTACLLQTDGVLSTVVNQTVVVSWGAQAACAQHINKAARFTTILYEGLKLPKEQASPAMTSLERSASPTLSEGRTSGGSRFCGGDKGDRQRTVCAFHAGLATGPVACGSVSAAPRQAHIALFGQTVDFSHMLCCAAAELNTHVLLASLGDDPVDRYQGASFLTDFLRPIDEWALVRGSGSLFNQNTAGGGFSMQSPAMSPAPLASNYLRPPAPGFGGGHMRHASKERTEATEFQLHAPTTDNHEGSDKDDAYATLLSDMSSKASLSSHAQSQAQLIGAAGGMKTPVAPPASKPPPPPPQVPHPAGLAARQQMRNTSRTTFARSQSSLLMGRSMTSLASHRSLSRTFSALVDKAAALESDENRVLVFELRIEALIEASGCQRTNGSFAKQPTSTTAVSGRHATAVNLTTAEDDKISCTTSADDAHAWSDAYYAAYVDKDMQALRTWAEEDSIVGQVYSMIRSNTHFPHAMAQHREVPVVDPVGVRRMKEEAASFPTPKLLFMGPGTDGSHIAQGSSRTVHCDQSSTTVQSVSVLDGSVRSYITNHGSPQAPRALPIFADHACRMSVATATSLAEEFSTI